MWVMIEGGWILDTRCWLLVTGFWWKMNIQVSEDSDIEHRTSNIE